ncbi:sulfate adenylyltransferase subunit CysN [Candidatus Purcelliella pentastirinorum]|uniref:sulfate adenylyltransferase n=1 Tax=Candidatus Purcelliella pentastirinorum TaxID=472834 RepID=A0AAX3NB64_9ENTR|nr:sulfate adenylyltransferase subunit CysN [Candidatus Purcelliella pentastirinorum]WDI78695.1 sulfate adenylyltransferase subunit CysN [Candidatus Purcelliella pentastirinorum]WDR80693.1 sulfate adenylyltransferase subunit CysN [Candidatus Purcelliella pentastirinorum]
MINNTIKNNISKSNNIIKWLKLQKKKTSLRFLTCGSVDDGKSTLIGRLFYDTNNIYSDQFKSLKKDSKKHGTQDGNLDLSLLVDGLQAEREQGITIDVAYLYFSTNKCKFIVADTPGHEQYTRNMATGASTCDVAILLMDACKGVLNQTKRHIFIVNILGIKNVIIAINKMDLVLYKEDIFIKIKKKFLEIIKLLPNKDIKLYFVPISALSGENVVYSNKIMSWYKGPTVLYILENIQSSNNINDKIFYFPVQYVNRPNSNFRGYSGCLSSGKIRINQKIKILPSGMVSYIDQIIVYNKKICQAYPQEPITLILKDQMDISRGDIIVDFNIKFKLTQSALIDIVWMNEQKLEIGNKYDVKIACKKTQIIIKDILYCFDMNNLKKIKTNKILINNIGRISVFFDEPMVMDLYNNNKVMGGIIFIDKLTNMTVGAGLVCKTLSIKDNKINRYKLFKRELNQLIKRYFLN